MAQKRTHDYFSELSSEDQNRKFAGIIPAGVYEGMKVAVNGTISPGMLYSADGVRIEESGQVIPRWGASWENMGVPPGHFAHPRRDLIVCQYMYEASVPPPQASYKVIVGTPAAEPAYPDIPENSIVLARCYMPAGAIVYTEVLQASPPERLVNCTLNPDGTHSVIKGALAAMRISFDVNTGLFAIYKRPAGTYEDGGVIDWEDPLLSLDDNGIVQLKSLVDALAATTPVPGSNIVGVKAKAGANGLLSIASGTLQTALEKLVTDGDAGLKSNADAISGHTGDATDAHAATAIGFSDSQYTATTAAAALIEMMTGFGKEHSIPKDGDDSKHKTLHFADPVLGAPRLLMDVSGGTGYGRYRQYFDGVSFWMTINAYVDMANGGKWTLDRSDAPALAFHMKYTIGWMYMARKAAYSTPWQDWDIQFDLQSAQIALNRNVDIDGNLGCDNLNAAAVAATSVQAGSMRLGEGGLTVTTGSGAPSGTPAPGSIYIRTSAATGHSGFYIYNTSDGWVELT